MMTLAQAHALLPQSRLVGDGGVVIARVHSDTRSLRPGDLFVALRGERFDGNDYLAVAQAAGAVAAVAERGLAGPCQRENGQAEQGHSPTMPGLLVPDALAALQQLAAGWRATFDLPLIAVTGSNGKTTVTQMIASILRAQFGDAALATAGNFNNHIGVPLTLLRLRPAHRAAVLELGMNHEGEIAALARMAAPTVALVNNAQREHQEFMDGVEAVARENGAVIEALPATGVAVIPADDAHTPLWRALAGARPVRTFASAATQTWAEADVTAQAAWDPALQAWGLRLQTPAGAIDTQLHQAGRHNLRNALAASACALAAGIPLAAVAQGLAAFRPVAGRSQLQALRIGGRAISLIDDSYNANPDSVRAAIDLLASLPGPRWLVLGDMGEVGAQGPAFHAEVGAHARAGGIDCVWTAGVLAAEAGADRHFESVAALLQVLAKDRPAAATVLIKGSRFMKMEQVVRALQALDESGAARGSDAA